MHRPILPLLAIALTLGACTGDTPPRAATASTADANELDPLLASIVNDPLMTDPQLTSRSNANAVRPPDQPFALMVPAIGGAFAQTAPGPCDSCATVRGALTLAAFAARQGDAQMQDCARNIGYDAAWANFLPAALPLPDRAQVIEAAGTNRGPCRLRVVSFEIDQSVADAVDALAARAVKVGYAVTRDGAGSEQLLTGRRGSDGTALALYARASGGMTAVQIAATGGR